MRILYYIFLIVLLVSCNQAGKEYHGYVYYEGQPLSGVKVIEDWYTPSRYTVTDSNGFFSLKRKNVIGNLIFIKDWYKIDTIVPIRTHAGENLSYIFLNSKPDTVYLEKR